LNKDIIAQLQLLPHPEGGYYRETYRSNQIIKTEKGRDRNVSTAILFLLENEDKSRFHRIQSDELWFFHQGQPLEIVFINNDQLEIIILGNDIDHGETPQAMIPANTWFGSRVKDRKGYSLVSCTVAPGFDFADFEMAETAKLTQEYPHLKDIIENFT